MEMESLQAVRCDDPLKLDTYIIIELEFIWMCPSS